jgi:hypothetical protein
MLPGAGTITAGGAGLTSMGLDMVADMLDPSVSKWEVVKNAGINTALAGLGMIPGGKSATILSKAVRYIPRVIGLASAAGVVLNPQVRGSLAKMSQAATDGGTTKLNVNDWKNILYAFQSALGVTSGVRARINHARFKGAYEAPERGKLVIKTNKFKVAAKTADKKATKIILNKD